MLQQVREQGYSLRNPLVEPRTSTLAVPIMDGQRVAASVGMTWITAAMPTDKAIERYLPELQTLAAEVSSRVSGRMAGKKPAAEEADVRLTYPDLQPAV